MYIKALGVIAIVIVSLTVSFSGENGKKSVAGAQVVPDKTLGKERSRVRNNHPSQEITGGAQRGSNLFHSFQEFSVPKGKLVYFRPQDNIANIFSRVTGKNISNIQGTLQVIGEANLFLLNPNGIIFGKNAQLSVGGSFIATTGESFVFGNGNEFSAKNPQGAPLLTVNVAQPIGIKFGDKQRIMVKQSPQSLGVDEGKTLGLLGGNIDIEETQIKAPVGKIILGAIGGNNTVNLTESATGSYSVSYNGIKNFGDISLSKGAKVYTDGKGSIEIQGRKITLTEMSQIYSTNNETQAGGNISITAKEIKAKGFETKIFTNSNDLGVGGNIIIETGKLDISLGAQILTLTSGPADSGNIKITAGDEIKIQGLSKNLDGSIRVSGLFTLVNSGATGKGGNIIVTTPTKLLLTEGSAITATTSGEGNGGNIQITAKEALTATGLSKDSDQNIYTTKISTEVQQQGEGSAGNINIDTGTLTLSQGAQISASTFSQVDGGDIRVNATQQVTLQGVQFQKNNLGKIVAYTSGIFARVQENAFGEGGDITINTPKLTILDVGRISTSTLGVGNAGNIIVNASQEVILRGAQVSPDGVFQPSSILAGVSALASGKGGNITIDTEKLTLSEGAQISATNRRPQGIAGNVKIKAGQVSLADRASVLTNTTQGDGGNISLSADKLLSLRQQSNISATAGNDQSPGNGGNINIDAQFIVSNPIENSNITANAFSGSGGQVNINSKGIFGIQANVVGTQVTSDITASSTNGPQGTVTINTPKVQPKIGVINLTSQPIVYRFIRLCENKNRDQTLEFYSIGRGGELPPPEQSFLPEIVSIPWVELISENSASQGNTSLGFDSMALFLPCQ